MKVSLFCSSYKFHGNGDSQKNFFIAVQRHADKLMESCSKCISFQLFKSITEDNQYIVFEIWEKLGRKERDYVQYDFQSQLKKVFKRNVQIRQLILANNTIINQLDSSQHITFQTFNAVECSTLDLHKITNKRYIPYESIWTDGLKKYTHGAKSKQIWVDPKDSQVVAITIIWADYIKWKEFPLTCITKLDEETAKSILPATTTYNSYQCYYIRNFRKSSS